MEKCIITIEMDGLKYDLASFLARKLKAKYPLAKITLTNSFELKGDKEV